MTKIEQKNELYEALLQRARIRAKDDFYAFVNLMAPVILPEEFKDGKHIKLICEHLQAVESGKIRRLMIEAPPGSCKSVLVNKLFSSWCFGRHPQWQVLTVSHSVDLAERFGRDVRDLLSSHEYEKIFPKTKLRPDVRAAGRWYTSKKGVFTAAGAGTSIAGTRANLGILDDVLSEQTVKSDLERNRILSWYGPGFRTRLLPNARVISVATRWHHMDLQGFLLEEARKSSLADQWVEIKIPAILDDDSADLLDLDTGGSYWPEMWSLDALKATRASTPARDWSALYMQNPTPEEGAIFKEDWFKPWQFEDPPTCDFVFLSLDTAFSTKQTADYSVIQAWGIFFQTRIDDKGLEMRVPNMILLSQQKGRYEYPDLRQKVQDAYKKFRPDTIVIEKTASGQSLIQDLQRANLPIREYRPDRDKISRAHAVSPVLSAGRVWLPNRAWAEELKAECLCFPLGAHDDAVDTMTQAILFMREGWMIGAPEEDHIWNEPPRRKRPRGYWKYRR